MIEVGGSLRDGAALGVGRAGNLFDLVEVVEEEELGEFAFLVYAHFGACLLGVGNAGFMRHGEEAGEEDEQRCGGGRKCDRVAGVELADEIGAVLAACLDGPLFECAGELGGEGLGRLVAVVGVVADGLHGDGVEIAG